MKPSPYTLHIRKNEHGNWWIEDGIGTRIGPFATRQQARRERRRFDALSRDDLD